MTLLKGRTINVVKRLRSANRRDADATRKAARPIIKEVEKRRIINGNSSCPAARGVQRRSKRLACSAITLREQLAATSTLV
jgi:hypothetical protein